MPAFLEYSFEDNTYSSIKEASNAIYDDIGKARLVKKIIVNKPEEGRLIFSGRRESLRGAPCSFYYLANITKEHIYTMEIALPLTSDKNEALHMAYIIDCLYRYCSFNGSQYKGRHTPRDYDDFVASGEYDMEVIMETGSDEYIDFDFDERVDLCGYNDIESPDDFTTYHHSFTANWPQDYYTVAYPANFYEKGCSTEEAADFSKQNNQLKYSFERNSYSSVKEAYHKVYDAIDKEKSIKNTIADKPEKGLLILSGKCTGYHNAKCSFYYLVNITDEHIYTMEIIFPLTDDKKEALHMAYIIDCLYRYCSFNGSQSEEKPVPRDYEDFVDSGEYDIELLMKE